MRQIVIFISLLLCGSVWGQDCGSQWLLNNNYYDEQGPVNLVGKNGITFETIPFEGTHSILSNNNYERAITNGKIDLTQPYTIIVSIYHNNTTSASRTIWSSRPSLLAKGISVEFTGTEKQIKVEGHNGSTYSAAYGALGQLTTGTWHRIAIRDINPADAYISIFHDGVRSGTDSTMLASCDVNDTISFCAIRPTGGYILNGYEDAISIYNRALTDAEILAEFSDPDGFLCDTEEAAEPQLAMRANDLIVYTYYYSDTIIPYVPEPEPEEGTQDTVVNDFTGKILYVDIAGEGASDSNTGLAEDQAITINGITAKLDNTFDYIVFSDTVHYLTSNWIINNIDNTYGSELKIQTWNKYNKGHAKIAGLSTVTGWSQSGNYWTKSGLTGLPAKRNDIFNETGEDFDFYCKSGMNGIYINGIWHGMSKYPDDMTYLSMEAVDGTNSWMRDNQGIATSGYWNNGMLQSQVAYFVPSRFTISSYLNNGTFYLTDIYGGYTSEWQPTQKYYILNHHNAANINGEWTQDFSTNSVEVFYTGNLNSQTVQLPLVDDCIRIIGSNYIRIKQLDFVGANKAQIRASNSTGLTIQQCNFSHAPVAAVATFGMDDLEVSYCNVNVSNDNGFIGLENYDQIYRYNELYEIGVNGFGGDRDGRHMQGICLNHLNGDAIVEYNIIDSCGYNGIGTYVATNAYADVTAYRNWINYSNMIMSDGASYYVSSMMGYTERLLRGNLITNTYENRAYHPTGADFSVGIYLDSTFPDDCAYESRGWTIDSNYTWNLAKNYFISINNARHKLINNTAASMTMYENDYDWGYYYKNSYTNCKTPDSLEITNNTYIMGPNGSGYFNYAESWNRFYAATNVLDYNDYRDPFNSTGLIWHCFNDGSGSPAWAEYSLNMSQIRAATPWEDHSTLNSPSWTMSNVTGITEDQMIWMYVNWTSTAHTFNLGSTIYKNLAGSDVSTSITVQPYKAVVLFYKSGAIPTHDNLTVYAPVRR